MFPLIILSLGLATFVIAAALLWRYLVQVSASVVVLVGIVDCLQLWTSGITLGVFVYPNDIACATLLAAGAIVTVRNGSVSREFCWGALLLFGLTIIDFLRGATTYGIKPAGNQARNIAYLLVPIVAFTAMQVNRRVSLSRITLWLCGVSWVFVAVAVFRWLGVLPTPEDVVASDAIRDVVRVVPADGAMIIGQALIAVLAMQMDRGIRTAGILTASCFVAILVALQHRSVWTATSVGILWLVFRSWRYAGPEWKRLAAIALGAAFIAFLLLIATGQSGKVVSLVKLNMDETQRDDSTWAWRVSGFSEAIERSFSTGVVDAAIGPPAGRDLEDVAGEASVHIHNRYVYMLAYYGITGLAAFGAWFWVFAARLRSCGTIARDRHEGMIEAVLLEALLISELTYFMANSGGLLHGATLGVVWLAAARKDEEYK
jgi:hypothetical protein